jgi:hypothetical protein
MRLIQTFNFIIFFIKLIKCEEDTSKLKNKEY